MLKCICRDDRLPGNGRARVSRAGAFVALVLVAASCTPVDEVPSPAPITAADGGEPDSAANSGSDARDAEPESGAEHGGRSGGSSTGGSGRGGDGPADAGDAMSSDPAAGSAGDAGSPRGGVGGASGASGAAGDGASGSAGDAGDGGEPSSTCSDEICDGLDNDCDAKIDEELTRECGPSPARGACKTGTETCTAGAWGACEGAIEATDEICDAEQLDEDCDGSSNEECACENGAMETCTGDSRRPCTPGMRMCTDGRWSTCMGAVGPTTEVCDDVDNDCDGTTDDNTTDCDRGETCRDGRCQCVPSCTNKACGSDGCGGVCPDTCSGTQRCNMGTSQCECTPQCNGRECGPNGCNGFCSPNDCADNQVCSSAGRCVDNCGNRQLDSGEECDDGNTVETDDCVACKDTQCGDGFVHANVEECEVFGGEWAGRCTDRCERTAYIRCPDGTTCPSGEVCSAVTGNTSQYMCTVTDCSACPAALGYVAECNFGRCMMLCNVGRTCPSRMACVPTQFVDPMSGAMTMRDICIPSNE